MRLFHKISAALAALLALPAVALAATIGGAYYMPQYDWQDFWAATDGKQFQLHNRWTAHVVKDQGR